MTPFLLSVLLVVLCFIQAAWLGMFALELFFDTTRSTAAERARTIFRYVAFLLAVQTGIVIIAILVIHNPPDFLRNSW
jgi:hypothetical protein